MSARLISENTFTANKKHLCDLCGQHIEVSEKYKRQFCVDGYAYAFKMHLVCDDIAKFYSKEYDSDGEGYDNNCFSYDVFDNFDSIVGFKSDGLKHQEALELFKKKWFNSIKKEG